MGTPWTASQPNLMLWWHSTLRVRIFAACTYLRSCGCFQLRVRVRTGACGCFCPCWSAGGRGGYVGTLHAHYMHITCALHAHYTHIARTLCTHAHITCTFITRTLHSHYIPTLHPHYTHITRTLHAHCTHIACTLHAH